MAKSRFSGKINLTSVTQVDLISWDAEFTFIDNEGVYQGTDAQINDLLLLDTSAYELGTLTRFKITSISSQSLAHVVARIEFADDNDLAPDPSYAVGFDGAIFRPTPKLSLSTLPAPGTQGLPDKFAIYPVNHDNWNRIDPLGGIAWAEYPLTFADFIANASSLSKVLFTLPAKAVIEKVLIKHSTEFTGGSLTSYTLQVGVDGDPSRYASTFDVFASASSSNRQMTISGDLEDLVNGTDILVTATSAGANLEAATQGAVSIWVQTSHLP